MANTASAASITVGFDGGPLVAPPPSDSDPYSVSPYLVVLPEPGTGLFPDNPTTVIQLHMATDASQYVNSFEADFELVPVVGEWARDRDTSNADWEGKASGINGDTLTISLTRSTRALGTEPLLVEVSLSCITCNEGDIFDVVLGPSEILYDLDVPPFSAPVDPFTTSEGTTLARVLLAVPEPGTALLVGAGLVGFGALRRRFNT